MGPGEKVRLEQYHAQAGGPSHGFCAALGAQLAQDGVDVERNGIFADAQPRRDDSTAQALSQPTRAVALSLPWCEVGGWIAVPGAATPPEPDPIPGVARHEVRPYQVPCGGPGRTLWLGWRD